MENLPIPITDTERATFLASMTAAAALGASITLVANAAIRALNEEGDYRPHILIELAQDVGQSARNIDRLATHAARAVIKP